MILAGLWFATTGLRHSAATSFRIQSNEALNSQDYGKAYQRAKYAAALQRSPENLNAYGAAAVLAGKSEKGYQAFVDSYGIDQNRAALRGQLSAAGLGGNQERAKVAAAHFQTPTSDFERALMVHALVMSGDLAAARGALDGDPESSPEAAARAIAEAPENQDTALALLAIPGLSGVNPPNDPAGLKQIETDVVSLPKDAWLGLTTTITAMKRPASSATRQILLANRMLEFDRTYTAQALATQAVRDEPGYRDAWNTLAAVQLELQNTKGAAQSLKISEELDGVFGYTWYLKSRLATQQGQSADAEAFKKRAELLGYQS